LHLGHLRLLTQIAEMGGIVMPPVPAFYHRPQALMEVVDHTLNRALDLIGIELERDLFTRWVGPSSAGVGNHSNGHAPATSVLNS
jgi:4-hydroxy-3-polyprenylbenzoate decarboxylase